MWVPSHVGTSDSEMADKAADLTTRIIPCTIATNFIKYSIEHKIYEMWQNYWDFIN